MAGFPILTTLSLGLRQVFTTDAIKTRPSWRWLDYWAASLGAPPRSHLPRVRVPTWRKIRLPRPRPHPRAATPQAVSASGLLASGGAREGASTLPSPGTEGAHGCEAEARGREAWAGVGWSGSPDGSLPSSLSWVVQRRPLLEQRQSPAPPPGTEGAQTLPAPPATQPAAFCYSQTLAVVVALVTTSLLLRSHPRDAVVATLLEARGVTMAMAVVVIATTNIAVAEALLPSPYAVHLIPAVAIKSVVATFVAVAVAMVVAAMDHLAPVALAVALINAVATLLPVVATERCCCQATSAGTVALVTLFVVVAALATRSAECDSLSSETLLAFAGKN